MKKEETNKKKGLFSVFAIIALSLGVGLTLKTNNSAETKALEQVVFQTDFGSTELYNWGSGSLTIPTQVPEGEVTVIKDRAAINNWDSHIVFVMAPITGHPLSYLELPVITGGLSSLELKYRPWDGNAEDKIRNVLETADLIVEKQDGADWNSVGSLDLQPEVNPNEFKFFKTPLTGGGKYRIVYSVSGDVRGSDRDQAIMIDDLVFYQDDEIGVSAVTALGVSPTTKELMSNAALIAADYEVTITKNGVAGSSNDYIARIGTGSGSEFSGSNIIWGTTRPKVSDTTIQFKAKYPTTPTGSTYLTAEVALSVTEPEFGNIQYIELMQEATKTEFYIGDTFTSEGLVLRAYDDSNPQKTIEISEGYTTDFDGVTFGQEHQGPKLVTVYYGEGSDQKETWYQINVRQVPKKYTKITSVSELHIGANYLITGAINDDVYYLTTSEHGNTRSGSSATLEAGKLVGVEDAQVIQLVPGTQSGTYGLRSLFGVRGFLTASSSDNDYLQTLPDLSEESSWDITFEEDEVVVVARGENTHNHLLFNKNVSDPCFSAYLSLDGGVSLWLDETSITTVPSVSITTQINYDLYEGDSVQFNALAFNAGEALLSWSVDETSVATIDEETGLLTTLSEGSFTVTASLVVEGETYEDDAWFYVSKSPYSKYTKVTNREELRIGAKYLIAATSESGMYVVGSSATSSGREGVSVLLKEGKIGENAATQSFELQAGNKPGTYSFKTSDWNNYYLAAASSSSDVLDSVNNLSDDASWLITFSGESLTLVSNGGSRRNTLGFEGDSEDGPIFSAYASSESELSLWVDQNSMPSYRQLRINRRQANLLVGDTVQFSVNAVNLGNTPIVWSVDNPAVASINEETGFLTALTSGFTKVHARVVVDGETYNDEVDVSVSSTTYDHVGSLADPFSVRDARQKADAVGTSESIIEYYVHGVISEIVEINTLKGYVTFKLRDKDGYSDLLAYQVKWGEEGSDFTLLTAENIIVGREVTLVGKLYKYENNTRQLVQNSRVLAVEEPNTAYEDAQAFAEWMMSKDREFDGSCAMKFGAATNLWNALSGAAKDVFKTHADFAEARARLIQWALANGVHSLDEIGHGGKGIKDNTPSTDKTNSVTLTVLIGVIGVTALAGYYFLKKRQTQK